MPLKPNVVQGSSFHILSPAPILVLASLTEQGMRWDVQNAIPGMGQATGEPEIWL